MTYFLMIMDRDGHSDEHRLAIMCLELDYKNVNFKLNRDNIVTFEGDSIELSEEIRSIPFNQTVVIEAHEREEDGNRRVKYTFDKETKEWNTTPIIPLFPAIQVLDFI